MSVSLHSVTKVNNPPPPPLSRFSLHPHAGLVLSDLSPASGLRIRGNGEQLRIIGDGDQAIPSMLGGLLERNSTTHRPYVTTPPPGFERMYQILCPRGALLETRAAHHVQLEDLTMFMTVRFGKDEAK